jgi:hypothetical protein
MRDDYDSGTGFWAHPKLAAAAKKVSIDYIPYA